MLRNFCTSTDLLKINRNLTAFISGWSGCPDDQFSNAFDRLSLDLGKGGDDTRLMMIPLWLSSSAEPHTDHITAACTSTKVAEQRTNRVHRFVIEKTACILTGTTNTIYLDGSLDGTNWDTAIATIVITTGVGIQSSTFSQEYCYYRYRVVLGTVLDMTAKIYLVETTFDILICYYALYFIYMGSSITDDDKVKKAELMEKAYEKGLAYLRYSYDKDESGTIEDGEQKENIISIIM